MTLTLFIIVIILAVIIVRVGALAFELTGLPAEKAFFQALSCFTGTGFTTKESELITQNESRRKIASALMILGNLGFITLIATFATHVQKMFNSKGWTINLPYFEQTRFSPEMTELIKVLITVFSVYFIYRIFIRSELSKKIFAFVKRKMRDISFFVPSEFEVIFSEFGNYQIIRFQIKKDSKLSEKKLSEVLLRSNHRIIVLAIERDGQMISEPDGDSVLTRDDYIICYGRRSKLKEIFGLKEE